MNIFSILHLMDSDAQDARLELKEICRAFMDCKRMYAIVAQDPFAFIAKVMKPLLYALASIAKGIVV